MKNRREYLKHVFLPGRAFNMLIIYILVTCFLVTGCSAGTQDTQAADVMSTNTAGVSSETNAEVDEIVEAESTDIVPTEEAWFDDAIFLGDSITGALYSYNLVYGGLGNAVIVYTNGFSCENAAENGYEMSYKGHVESMGEIVADSAANKVFLLFAMNDVGKSLDDLSESWRKMIDHIREYSNADIYIQSGTPIYSESGYFTNENMRALNDMLKAVCEETDCIYVDISRNLADENGALKKEYHNDYVHFGNDGCAVWINELYDPASYSY
jgi:lysophospholipase L1-like esterase